jgi:hypothetical protein
MGARARTGGLLISLHGRLSGGQCTLGFRSPAFRNYERSSNFGERARSRTAFNLALPFGGQKEFVTRAFNALAGTGNANRE